MTVIKKRKREQKKKKSISSGAIKKKSKKTATACGKGLSSTRERAERASIPPKRKNHRSHDGREREGAF